MTLKASCFCCTYGRPHLLEEAVESFLRQDYEGPKELIILNDFDGHTLHFEHPEVVIVNSNERIVPLGHKFNVAASMCSGDVLFPWEDDDIYLPWRIRYSMQHMTDGIFHTAQAWLDQAGGQLKYTENLYQCNLAVAKDRWNSTGGYREDDISAIDLDLFRRLDGYRHTTLLDETDIFYIYRWASTGSYHGSGMGGLIEGVSEAAAEFIEQRVKSGEVPLGKITLQPKWSRDWCKAQQRALADGESRQRFVEASASDTGKSLLQGLTPWHPGIDFEDHLIVPSRERDRVFVLNPVARVVWRALNSGVDIDVIKNRLAARWQSDEMTISQDVDGLLQQWATQNLIGPGHYSHTFQTAHRYRVEFPDARVSELALSILTPCLAPSVTTWDHSLAIREEDQFYAYYKDGLKIADQLYSDQAVFKLVEDIASPRIVADEPIALSACVLTVREQLILVMGEGLYAPAVVAKLLAFGGTLVGGDTINVSQGGEFDSGSPGLRILQRFKAELSVSYPSLVTAPVFYTGDSPFSYLSGGFQRSDEPLPANNVRLVQLVQDGDLEPEELTPYQRLDLLLKQCHLTNSGLSDSHIERLAALAKTSRGVRVKTASATKMADRVMSALDLPLG